MRSAIAFAFAGCLRVRFAIAFTFTAAPDLPSIASKTNRMGIRGRPVDGFETRRAMRSALGHAFDTPRGIADASAGHLEAPGVRNA